jgi:hypothetical protein
VPSLPSLSGAEMTISTLVTVVGYWARLTRLSTMEKRTKAQNAELYWLRAELIEIGIEIP